MGIFETIKENIKKTIQRKRYNDKIYQDAFDEEYRKGLKEKAISDARNKLKPRFQKTVKDMFSDISKSETKDIEYNIGMYNGKNN